MKLRKFFGLTSRSVLEQVRAELGADAVIVANHATAEGVEVTALAGDAIDTLLAHGKRPAAAVTAPESQAAPLAKRRAEPATAGPVIERRAAPATAEPVIARRAAPATAEPVPERHAAPATAGPVIERRAAPATAEPVPERHAGRPVSKAPIALVEDLEEVDEEDVDDFVIQLADSFSPALDAPPGTATEPPRPAPTQDTLVSRVLAEVAAMRDLIEERFALVTWSDNLRRRPMAAKLTRDLLAAGYSPALARTITERLPDDMSAREARDWVAKLLAHNLKCVGDADEIVARGGVFALIGPTGVGKTTTTAKLAARCAVRYGANRLALITTDSFRVGAHDQLRIYAKILGVAVHTVSDRHDLRQALDAVRGRHLVLIDTVGMSQRDARVAEQAMLLAQPEIHRILLLNAAAQGETLDEAVASYGRLPDATDRNATNALAGCIITKQDEACRRGAALDVAIRHKLPLHYVTSGQRVPEDLFVPTSELMIRRSLRSASTSSAFTLTDDELPLAIAGPARVAHA